MSFVIYEDGIGMYRPGKLSIVTTKKRVNTDNDWLSGCKMVNGNWKNSKCYYGYKFYSI